MWEFTVFQLKFITILKQNSKRIAGIIFAKAVVLCGNR